MTKYELSLTKNYVPDWTLLDGVREFFQNAVDQETMMENNHMFWNYNEERQVLSIGNKLSVLEPKSLLLGATTKMYDSTTIGQFGEGYKVATLVLLRLGKTIKFYNYGAKEVWTPRFSKSRKYNAEILVFDVDKKYPWSSVPDNNLTIEIGNITEDELNDIEAHNLHMQDEVPYYKTELGRILKSKATRGKVFVNGLHICDYDKYRFGYDFKPEHIDLDRDRKLISDFNLEWLASKMWSKPADDTMTGAAVEMIRAGAADVKYVKDTMYLGKDVSHMSKSVHESFVKDHGANAVPVTSTEELDKIPEGYVPIIVSEQVKSLVTSSREYTAPKLIENTLKERLKTRLDEWVEVWGYELSTADVDALYDIIEEEVPE